MQKRKLGRTDLTIAPLVFGGNVFGWTVDKKTTFELLDRFFAAGLNAVDTADVYSAWAPGNKGGESETILGEWMKARGKRSQTIVVTKVGSPMGPGKKGLKAKYIEEAAEASLRRLQVETIDLYLSHWPDPEAPHEETLGAYAKLIAAGKIRWCGASNYNAEQMRAALDAAKAKGLPRYEVLQPEYNLYDRGSYDGALRDLCIARGDRRHHLFQPRQRVPERQISQRGRSRAEPARRRRRGVPQSARIPHPRCARRNRRGS